MAEEKNDVVMSVRDLTIDVRGRGRALRAINGVSFDIRRGETVAVVGESGSGKSLMALGIMGLLPDGVEVTGGSAELLGRDVLGLTPAQARSVRGLEISLVFQDALSALHPMLTVGAQIREAIRAHSAISRRDARERVIELMESVGIPAARDRYRAFPHQFSGGMRQRVMIAMALAMSPSVVIADEPTTALDVTIQAQIMSLLDRLRRERNMALVLITHDLGVVADVADRVIVMYAGRVVEHGPVEAVLRSPAHPYTRGLIDSIPSGVRRGEPLTPIPGSPPALGAIPSGCVFRTRCRWARETCRDVEPELRPTSGEQCAACHFIEELSHVA